MIIRSNRTNKSLFARLFSRLKAEKGTSSLDVLSSDAFDFEMAKETSRSNRRSDDREYSVVLLESLKPDPSEEQLTLFLRELRDRLRITDSIGSFRNRISILCPETDRDGAKVVANQVAKVGLLFELQIETEVLVYPWDDPMVASSKRLRQAVRKDKRDDDENMRGQGGFEFDQNSASLANGKTSKNIEPDQSALAQFSVQGTSVGKESFSGVLKTPWWKRATDVLVAGTLILLLSPVFLVAAIAIKLNSRGPVFFKQIREGKDGRHFSIWKFRTMVLEAESQQAVLRNLNEQDGPAFKLRNDPRVTPVGRYLRRSCVDELPQLVNVLWGQMSMVGPRPLPVDESTSCEPWQRRRLVVLPGLTCIWQVDGGRDALFSDWMRMDMRYIKQRSFLFDLKLIFKTAIVALLHRGSV